jgi:hypothetical protein
MIENQVFDMDGCSVHERLEKEVFDLNIVFVLMGFRFHRGQRLEELTGQGNVGGLHGGFFSCNSCTKKRRSMEINFLLGGRTFS